MPHRTVFVGMGYAVGSREVSNRQFAVDQGRDPDWYISRTGIETRRTCGPDESVLTLARRSIEAALRDVGISTESLGHETVLLYIQNGLTHGTPPPGIILCRELGAPACRTVSIDGVCAEPINTIEFAELMLAAYRCDRVIVCASADFLDAVDPTDTATSALFGAGAGAVILERAGQHRSYGEVLLTSWSNDSSQCGLGVIDVLGHECGSSGVDVRLGYYRMDGPSLARVCMKLVPRTLDAVINAVSWNLADVDLFITHQPNSPWNKVVGGLMTVEGVRI